MISLLDQSRGWHGIRQGEGGDDPTTTEGPETEPPPPKPRTEPETFYLPIYCITAIFGAIFIFGPLIIRKGPNRGITRCCIMMASFCLWIFWLTMYIAQMNPLMGPRLHNTTLAWIGHRWGLDPKTINNTK